MSIKPPEPKSNDPGCFGGVPTDTPKVCPTCGSDDPYVLRGPCYQASFPETISRLDKFHRPQEPAPTHCVHGKWLTNVCGDCFREAGEPAQEYCRHGRRWHRCCDPEANVRRAKEPAPRCHTCGKEVGVCKDVSHELPIPQEPTPEGDESEVERARRDYRQHMLDGDQACPLSCTRLDVLMSAERADAARQERRRTLREVQAKYLDADHRTAKMFDWLNERIREAGGG